MSDEQSICPRCGSLLEPGTADGQCAACLLRQGIGPETRGFSHIEAVASRWEPPGLDELAGQFPQLQILELLGRGGMGAVYKVRQQSLERLAALKILPPTFASDPAFAERFAQEARAMAKLNHPNIVTLYEFGCTSGGLYFFLMEYVDGVSLRRLMDAGRVAPREALAIVPQVCDALQYAHDAGVVHRDIKPENILLDRRGRVKVADFGLAKIAAQPEAHAAAADAVAMELQLTEAGRVMGTPQYMAPEQAEHPAAVDHRADIYALGVVFYQMLTGELPAKQIVPPSRKVLLDVRLDEVVLRALEHDPQRRYYQASELKTGLETVARGAPPAHAEARTGNAAARPRRAARPGISVGVLVTAIAAVIVVFVWSAMNGATGQTAQNAEAPAAAELRTVAQSMPPGSTSDFGPTIERVLPDPDNGNAQANEESLQLSTGRMINALAGTPGESGGGARLRALLASDGDLLAEYDDFVSGSWALVTAGLKLGDITNRQWDSATAADVEVALAQPTALRHMEHQGAIVYQIADTFVPLTLAFETRDAARGLLQIVGFKDNPRAVTIRYKFLQVNGAATNHAASPAAGPAIPPVVIRTVPEAGSAGVDPALGEIQVTFSKAMKDGNWSWVKLDDKTFPAMTGPPRFDADGRTCILPVKLQPRRVYVIWLNSDQHHNFIDTAGEVAVPYLLVFETGE